MICPCNEILLSHRKKWDTSTCYTTDEPWKYYAKSKKPGTKAVCYMISFIGNVQVRELCSDSGFQGPGKKMGNDC